MDPKLVEIYSTIGFACNPDGSLIRQREITADPTTGVDPSLVLTKDISINQSKNTWARVILPRQALDSPRQSKLPLILFFHGGGFVVAGVDEPSFQDFYRAMATEISAAVVSVSYRRAPEHRLPAAYDDCLEALHWVKNTDDEWLRNSVDFSRCFIMGESAGGNLAYRVGLRASTSSSELKPLEIKGLILHEPFFGGKERAGSELRSENDKVLPLMVTDVVWEMALPLGVDRDHVYCNPTVEMKANPGMFDEVKRLGWKIWVSGSEGDPTIDRQVEVLNSLQNMGVKAVGRFIQGGRHGIELSDPPKAKELCIAIKDFVES
ncbi:PREDICTED: carboxylesterase 1-like [Ipomoea nil]|uniref:carboxylesterase 1-like n=1 Tax=Ipomoea nil TaxID=35883 RepID=UPI000900F17E|nr:PREDICTED: carboxylesterase 1-like [Ipomoea nil]